MTKGHRPHKKNGTAQIITLTNLVIPISETVIDRKGRIISAVDESGYPTIIDPNILLGGHIMDVEEYIDNIVEINHAFIKASQYGLQTHMPVYFARGEQRIAHISPLPRNNVIVQVWATKSAEDKQEG